MTFFKHTTLTDESRLARRVVLASVLIAPLVCRADFDTPQRPASVLATRTIPPAASRSHSGKESHSYLAMVGPSAIRFAEAEPSLPSEPVLPTPPKPKTPPPALTPGGAAQTPADGANSNPAPATASNSSQDSAPDAPKPVSILPDDTRHEIRAEEVLPFFQFPNGADNAGVVIPMTLPQQSPSNPVPPSTATYRQQ